MPVVAAAVVPHAPLIVLGRAPDTATAARSVLADLPVHVPLVLLSPHGARSAVRTHAAGSLAPFGIPGEPVASSSDPDLAVRLAAGWSEVVAPDPADQGVVVPLILAQREVVIVPVSFVETTGPGAATIDVALDAAERAAKVIEKVAADHDLVVVASAHTGAALTERAPLLENPAAHELHQSVVSSLEDGKGIADIPLALWEEAGSCGAAPFTALEQVTPGRSFEVRRAEWPFGVGYVSAIAL